MQLYIPLIIVALLFAVGLLSLNRPGARRPGPLSQLVHLTTGASAAACLGLVLIASSGILPDALSAVVGNTLVVLALVLMDAAVRQFRYGWYRKDIPVAVVGVFFLSFLSVSIAGAPPWFRQTLAGALGGTVSLISGGVLMHRPPSHQQRSYEFNGLLLAGAGVFRLATTLSAAVAGGSDRAPFASDTLQSVYAAVLLLTIVGVALGLLVMSRERREIELAVVGTRDGLTSAYGSQSFLLRASRELMRCLQNGLPACVLMLGVDPVRELAGKRYPGQRDEILGAVASTVSARLRSYDVIARYGDHTLCVLLPDTRLREALKVAERVRAAVQGASIRVGPARVGSTVSVGVAGFEGGERADVPRLLATAERALTEAHQKGGNRVVAGAWSPDFDDDSSEPQERARDLAQLL